MKKITTLILALSFALSMTSCQKEIPTPEPSPDVSQTDTTIVYKVYADNPDISFNVVSYSDTEGYSNTDVNGQPVTFQGQWSKTIAYQRGTQLDQGLYLDFIVYTFVSTPDCPAPPPNYDGNITGEIWFNDSLVASQTINRLDGQGSLYHSFN